MGSGQDLDEVSDRVAITALETRFQGWLVYRGVEGLCHARHHQDDIHVRGESWVDLRDMLIREAGANEK